ncbi:MAG: cytoplasmic protein [Tardiphaga sp.]|nr:cytoplasmic protein [Tardiphaga sp.]
MSRTSPSHPLTKAQARPIWLHAQRLDSTAPFGDGPSATAAAVEHLGYVQIDTINVIERSHHHVLFTRIPAYRRTDLRQAQSIDKTVFEYWTHALSYVPTRDLKFFVADMRQHRREPNNRFNSVKPADLRKVLRLIKKDGALTIRDIEDDVLVDKDHPWASRKPSKRALQLAFYTGVLTISARSGMLKTYELMDRHFGWDKSPKAASATEISSYLLDRALRSQGIVSLDSICHLDAPSNSAVRRLIEARLRRRELVPVALEGAGKLEHWARPEVLEPAGDAASGMVHILSPFDPLVIQRKRTHLFFDYEHRFEAYIPKEKRLFGYFALPVLVDGYIVAAIDLKTDRQKQKLLMQKWNWIGKRPRKDLKRRIEEELHRFERFQLADDPLRETPAVAGV